MPPEIRRSAEVDCRKLVIAVAVAAGMASPAAAAPPSTAATASSTGKALILLPLKITKIDDLDFGAMIAPPSPGTVTLSATDSSRSFTGGAVGVSSDLGHRAYFGGAGTGNQQVIVTLVPPAQLTSTNGDTIDVIALTLDKGGNPIRTIDPTTRTFYVGVGGVLSLAANQADGDYTGTFQLLANYQ
jgi:hypothetical protein